MSLTTVETVAAFLGLTFTPAQAEQAAALLPAADAAIAAYTDRAWLSPPLAGEAYTAEGPLLVLRQRPVASVEGVAAAWGNAPPRSLAVGTQYTVRDLGRGLVLLSPWWTGRPNDRAYATLQVDYTPASTVPADVALAATLLVAAWLQPSLEAAGSGAAPGPVVRTQVGDVSVQYASSAPAAATAGAGGWPPAVTALLAPYRAALGVA